MHNNIVIFACSVLVTLLTTKCDRDKDNDTPIDDSPIGISSPTPRSGILAVMLDDGQKAHVKRGNSFALRCLNALYNENDLVFSPLSLQYALAMTVNGASGATADEITNTLGFDKDVAALNELMKTLLVQLPAVDTDVELKVTDAMLIDKSFRADSSFVSILNDTYFAPIEYIDTKNTKLVVDRINDWASRNTNGFISPFVSEDDLSDSFIATILNALYFKAKWANYGEAPLFDPTYIRKSQPFYLDGGGETTADFMDANQYLRYAKREGYQAVELPFTKCYNGKFVMYILLPDKKKENGLKMLINSLSDDEWNSLVEGMTLGPEVHVLLPAFEINKRYHLRDMLMGLGIERAFIPGKAEFNQLFQNRKKSSFWINEILQKSRIKVTEWGTEAGSVTAVMMVGASGIQPNRVQINADHPFIFFIVEKSSGIILFEGAYTGKE